MKKTLLTSIFLLTALTVKSQITIFQDGFETYNNFAIAGFGQWSTLDVDGLNTYIGGLPTGTTEWTNAGDPQAFIIFNPSAAGVTNNLTVTATDTELRNFDPHGGSKYAAAWDAVPSTTGGPTANEDWLISPPITLGLTGNNLSFWVKSLSSTYGLEKFKVGIFVGTTTPTSSSAFTVISGATALQAPYTSWAQQNYALAATYAGQTVRIGIQCVSADNYMFMVDDFLVTATTLGTKEVSETASSLSVYPNPTSDILNIKTDSKIKSVTVFDMSGRKVKASFENNVLNVKDLQTGTYVINVETAEGKFSERFIKK